MRQPTDRQLDVIAAWWYAKGSNLKAAKLLGIGHQPVRNALYHLRTAQQVDTNLDLAMRFMDQINERQPASLGRTSHNARPSRKTEAFAEPKRKVTLVTGRRAKVTEHTFSDAESAKERHVTLVTPLFRDRISRRRNITQGVVEPSAGGEQPFDLHANRSPPRLELLNSPVIDPLSEVCRDAVAKLEARITTARQWRHAVESSRAPQWGRGA